MTETKIYCDHCQKELDSLHDYTDITLEVCENSVKVDLCVACFKSLNCIIRDFCTPSNTVNDNDVGNIKQQPVRYCEYCDKKGDVIYTSLPPKIKCAITGEYHDMHDVCNVQFK